MPTAAESAAPIRSLFAGDADMADLVSAFVAEMPGRVTALEGLWREQALEDLRRAAHQLKGSGGGYGFPVLSAAAAELEQTLNGLAQGSGQRTTEDLRRAYEQLTSLCRRVGV